jgi:hypothetical protein
MEKARKVSTSAALIALVCFFLPWIQVSCGGSKDLISGVHLARDGHALLWIIPVLLTLAIVLNFARGLQGKLDWPALINFVAGLVSSYLMNRERLRAEETAGLLAVSLTVWFWLGLFGSILTTILGGFQFLKRPKID